MTGAIAVARYTILELMRRRVLWLFGAGGLVLVALIGIFVSIAPRTQGTAFSQASGILLLFAVSGVVSFFSFLAALAIGSTAISHDLASGSVVSIFSKPLSRVDYATGKLLAAVGALLAIEVVLAVGTQALLLVNGGGYEDIFLKLFGSVAANQVTILVLVLALTALFNNVAAAIVGVVTINISNFVALVYRLNLDANGNFAGVAWAARVLHWILPRNLDYNVAVQLLGQSRSGGANLASGSPQFASSGTEDVIYWAAYLVLLCAALVVFLRRKQV